MSHRLREWYLCVTKGQKKVVVIIEEVLENVELQNDMNDIE